MANSIAALELFMRVLPEGNPHLIDPLVIPRPWVPATLPKKLRIGILRHNNIIRPQPPISRALCEVEAKLVAAGHEGEFGSLAQLFVSSLTCAVKVVEWKVGDMHQHLCRLAWMFFGMDGGSSLKEALGGAEPILPNVDTGNAQTLVERDEILAGYWQSRGLRAKHLNQWAALGLDAVIAPGGSHVASAHNKFKWVSHLLAGCA